MAFISARDTEVHISATVNGTYACLEGVLTLGDRETGSDDERNYVLCSDVPITETGNDESTLELAGLLDLTAAMQNLLRTAQRNNTVVYARVLWDGVSGYAQPFIVQNFNTDVDPNGTGVNKFVRWTMTLASAGARTAYPVV